jgi:hypothetical protein
VKSLYELKEKLQEIKEEVAKAWSMIFAVDIVMDNVGVMSIALDEKCILSYTDGVPVGETNLTSLGDISAEGNTLYYFGDHTRMSNKYIISYNDALDALEYWFNTGVLSDKIAWTEELFSP